MNIHNPWATMGKGINGKPFLTTVTEKVTMGVFSTHPAIQGSIDEEIMDPIKQEH